MHHQFDSTTVPSPSPPPAFPPAHDSQRETAPASAGAQTAFAARPGLSPEALAGITEYESWFRHLGRESLHVPVQSTPRISTMTPSLYERLGGAGRIAAVIDDALDRHTVNPLLAPRFAGKDLPRLKQLGTQFFCTGSGGPQAYEGRDMRSAHRGMNISEQEFIAAIDDIVAALQAQGIGPAEVNEVVGILYSMKGEVLRT